MSANALAGENRSQQSEFLHLPQGHERQGFGGITGHLADEDVAVINRWCKRSSQVYEYECTLSRNLKKVSISQLTNPENTGPSEKASQPQIK